MNDGSTRIVNSASRAVQDGMTPPREQLRDKSRNSIDDYPPDVQDRALARFAVDIALAEPNTESHSAARCPKCRYVGPEYRWETVCTFRGNREQPSEWEWECPACGHLGDFDDVQICDCCKQVIEDKAAHDGGRCVEVRDA